MAKSYPVLCGSISGSIGGMGVKLHNAAFAELGLEYTYVSFEPTSVMAAVEAMKSLGIRGLGVSMPFKETILPFLDSLDAMSSEIGAINTVVNDSGTLTGYNTDAFGAISALKEIVDPTSKRVAVIGAGGAAKTIVWALKEYTNRIKIYNRDTLKGQIVASHFNVDFGGDISALNSEIDYEILINCTSVGFKSNISILTRHQIKPCSAVLDVVFTPNVTAFQVEALAANCSFVSGTRMIMHQACKQFELYTGLDAPIETYERVISSIVNSN